MNDPALVSGRLNVTDLVSARKSEIKDLQSLIGNSGTQAKKRAFQLIPRTERRRAASHDFKRVPKRKGLRKRAAYEIKKDNAGIKPHSKRILEANRDFKACDLITVDEKVPLPLESNGLRYFNRQKDKIWLPTHIWHKKRAFLKNVAGFMVPYTSTQKQYRRTYRLSNHLTEHGSMAWDTSYYSSIIVHSNSEPVASILNRFFIGIDGPMYANGEKHYMGLFQDTAPALVHLYSEKSAFVHIHPLIFNEVWAAFSDSGLSLEDARFAIGSIDLLGPESLAILTETLTPESEDMKSAWNSLGSSRTVDILPYRLSIALNTLDPRLFARDSRSHRKIQGFSSYSDIISRLKTAQSSENNVYSRENRQESLNALCKQFVIDKRVKDGKVELLETDARIPITIFLLDDRRVRIILPKDWVLPFWLSVFKRKRVIVGGYKELDEIALMSLIPRFPLDFPASPASREVYNELGESNKAEHLRKPPSKRPFYERDLGNPFKFVDYDLIPELLTPDSSKQVKLTSVKRGWPRPGARLFALTEPDMQMYMDGSMHPVPRNLERGNVLGFVTSGNFVDKVAEGAGIGVVKSNNCKFCLVKNLGSDSVFAMAVKDLPKGVDQKVSL